MTSSAPRKAPDSRAAAFVEQFRSLGPEVAPKAILATWRKLPIAVRAAIFADWSFWARTSQIAPEGEWRSWGFLTGRGFGKTLSVSKYIQREVANGRAPQICLLAQDEQQSIDLQVLGPSGLVNTAPPWFRPEWQASARQLVWPNGSVAYVRTPERPVKIRGLDYHLTWATEIPFWPKGNGEEAFRVADEATRLGIARIVWDATPKLRHALLKELVAQSYRDPILHRLVTGHTTENAANLSALYLDELERKYAGTLRGRMELLGEMPDDSEGALWRNAWIEDWRQVPPSKLLRRVISVDPAVTDRKGSDTTGIVDVGLGENGRAYVFGDHSGKHDIASGKWAELVLDLYLRGNCDLIIAETNKGGQFVTHSLRVVAQSRGLEVIVLGKDERARPHTPGKVFVREVYARGSKADRAEPVATAYERGRVSHVIGADLSSLEDTLTMWEPEANTDSPGDLDALVHAVVELLGLSNNEADPKAAFVGLAKAAEQLRAPSNTSSIAHLFQTGRGDRI